jgi:hypothetical protein
MDNAKGQTREKKARSTFVLHAVTIMGRYIMSGSWEKHGMHETGKRELSSDGGHCDVHKLPLLRSTLASPIRQPLLSQGIYPGQFYEQCRVWRFLFRSWCSSHYIISRHDVCVCEYSHRVGVRCFRLYAFVLWLPVGNEGETVAL